MPTSSSAAYGSYKPQPIVHATRTATPQKIVDIDMNKIPQIESTNSIPTTTSGFCTSTCCKILTGLIILALLVAVIILAILLIQSQNNASKADKMTTVTAAISTSMGSITLSNSSITPVTSSTTISSNLTTGTLPFYGVQFNLNPLLLPLGWSQCHSSAYAIFMDTPMLNSTLNACNKGKLLLACRSMNSTNLTVAAVGFRSDVLYNCGTSSSCTNIANGVGWYYSDLWSWGFVNASETVARTSCDMNVGATRLCWHTGQSAGGYRCASSTGLNTDWTTERVIYHSN